LPLYLYRAHKIPTTTLKPTTKSSNNKHTSTKMTKIAIVYYSTYGHVTTMAEAVKKGVEAGGASVDIFQVPETLSEAILTKMGAPPKADHPIITPDQLADYDGIIFGVSGRFGMMSAQLKVGSKLLSAQNHF
jgi:flavorubredoxin